MKTIGLKFTVYLVVIVSMLESIQPHLYDPNTQSAANEFIPSRRNLIEKSESGRDCEKCILLNKNVCWQFKGTSMSNTRSNQYKWQTSYCCGSSDSQCNSLEFCSRNVRSSLKHFGCPVDEGKCPSLTDSNVVLTRAGKSGAKSKKEQWNSIYHRYDSHCKYKISVDSSRIKIDPDKYDSSYVIVMSSRVSRVSAKLIYLKDGKFNSKTSYKLLKAGKSYTIKNPQPNDQLWIQYEPETLKAGYVGFKTYITQAKLSAEEIAIREEAERQRQIEEQVRLEEERIKKIEEQKRLEEQRKRIEEEKKKKLAEDERIAQEEAIQREEQKKIEEENARLQKAIEEAERKIKEQQELARKADEERKKREQEEVEEQKRLEEEEKLKQERLKQQDETKKQQDELEKLQKERGQKEAELKKLQEESNKLEEERKKNEDLKKRIQEEEQKIKEEQELAAREEEDKEIDEVDNSGEDDESVDAEDQGGAANPKTADDKEKTDTKTTQPTRIVYKNPDGTTSIIEDAVVDENGQITIIVESKPTTEKPAAVIAGKEENEDFTYPLIIGMLASALVTIIIVLLGRNYLFKQPQDLEDIKKRDRRLSTQNEELALNQFHVNNSSKDSYASHIGLLNNPKINLRAVLGGKVNLAEIQGTTGSGDDVFKEALSVTQRKNLLEKLGLTDSDINDELHKEILLYIKLRNGGLDQTPRKELQSLGIDEDKIEKVRGYVERIARQQESVKFSQNGDIENQGIPRITMQDLEARSEVQSQSEYLNQMQNIYFNKSVSRAKTANAQASMSSDKNISINDEADQATAIKRKTTPNGFNLGSILKNKNPTAKIGPTDQDHLQLESAIKGQAKVKYGQRNSSNKKFLTADGTHADNTAQPLDTMENDDFQHSIEKKKKMGVKASQSRSNNDQIGAGVIGTSLQEFYETNRNFNQKKLDERKKSTKVPSENPYDIAKVDVNSASSREGSVSRVSLKLTNIKQTTNRDSSQYDEIKRVYQDQDDAIPTNQQNSSLEDTQLGVNDTRDQINSSLLVVQKSKQTSDDGGENKVATQNSLPNEFENEIKMMDIQDDNMQEQTQKSFRELTQVNESSHEDLNGSGHFQRTQEPILTDVHDSHQFSYMTNQPDIQMSVDQKSANKTPKKQNTFLYKGENLVVNTTGSNDLMVLQSEPFNTDEVQFNKVQTAMHESPENDTQDSNFVDQVKKAMVISPMKLNPKTTNEDGKPMNFIHQTNQNDELIRVVSFARGGLQDPNQQSPMTPGAFDDLRNQLSQNLISRDLTDTPYLGQKKHLGYTSTAKKDEHDTLTKNLLEDTPSERSPPKKHSLQNSIGKKESYPTRDVQPIIEEVENEELRSPGRSPPIDVKKSKANIKFTMHALKQTSINSSQQSIKKSPTKNNKSSARGITSDRKVKMSPVPKKTAQKTEQNNTPQRSGQASPDYREPDSANKSNKQIEQKKEIVGLMRSTFTSMAKVSELFNKVEELDDDLDEDVVHHKKDYFGKRQIMEKSDHLSSEEDEVLRDLISQKSRLEDVMRKSSYSPMRQGSVFDLPPGEVTGNFQSPIADIENYNQQTNETVNIDSKLRFDTDEELKQNETIHAKPTRSKRSTTLGPEKKLNKKKSDQTIKMKSIEQTLNNGIRQRFTIALEEVGKKSLRPLPDAKPQEVNPQIVKDLEKQNDKDVKRGDNILNKFMQDVNERQSKKGSIPNATQSNWDKGSSYYGGGGKSMKSQTMSNWDQKFKVDRKSGISGVSIENMKKATQEYQQLRQSNQEKQQAYITADQNPNEFFRIGTADLSSQNLVKGDSLRQSKERFPDVNSHGSRDSMQTHKVRDSTKLKSYNQGKGIAGELGNSHASQEQRNQNFQSLYQVESNKQPLGGFMGDSGLQNTILKKYKDYGNTQDSHRPQTQGGSQQMPIGGQYASGAVIGQYQPPTMVPKKTSTVKHTTNQLGQSFNITNILHQELDVDSHQSGESYSPTRQQNLIGRGNKTSGRGATYAKSNFENNMLMKDDQSKYRTEAGKSETGGNNSNPRISMGQITEGRTQHGEMATLAEQDSKRSTKYEISKQFVKHQFQKQQRLIEAKNPNLTSAQNILTNLSNNASKNLANNTETKYNDVKVGVKPGQTASFQGTARLNKKVTMKNKKDLNKTGGGMKAIGAGLVFNPGKQTDQNQFRTQNNSYLQKGDQRAKSQYTEHIAANGLRNGDQLSNMISTPNILGSKASRLTGSNIGAQIMNQQKQVSTSFEGNIMGISPNKVGSIEDNKSDLKSFYNDGV